MCLEKHEHTLHTLMEVHKYVLMCSHMVRVICNAGGSQATYTSNC